MNDSLMNTMVNVTGSIDTAMYTYVLVFLLVAAGLWFSFRTKFVQIRLVKDMLKAVTEQKHVGGSRSVSSFQALMISTASRVGTGNIAGVAVAIGTGGPGALFWMWLIATIGAASAFIESTLAQIFKVRGKNGEFRGGPAYYIEQGLHKHWLGVVFSVLLILCFAYGFNALQSYNMSSSFAYYISDYTNTIWPLVIAILTAIFMAVSIFGGSFRIKHMTSIIVPIMAIGYIVLAIVITFMHITDLPLVFATIFSSAFDFQSIAGGFAGSVATIGIKRGLYSNEAGMGSAPNAAASASVSHPVKQGLVQTLSVFIDTMVICTCTGMMLMVFYVNGDPTGLNGMPLVQAAMQFSLGNLGIHFITIAVALFALSSLIGNYFYAESNIKFINKSPKLLFVFRITCVIAVFAGALSSFDLAWNVADIVMGLQAFVNLIAIFLLGGWAIKALDDFMVQKKQGKNPVFVADTIEGLPLTECWHETAEELEEGDEELEKEEESSIIA